MSCPVFSWVRTVTHWVLPTEDRMSVWDAKRERKWYSFVQMSESFRWLSKLFHTFTQVSGAFRSAGWWREPGEIWDQKWVFGPIPEQQKPTESRAQVYFCVNETLITTNTHRDSQTKLSRNNVCPLDRIGNPKPKKMSLHALAGQSLYLITNPSPPGGGGEQCCGEAPQSTA